MFEIRRYDDRRHDEWNAFVAQSKNGTFLFDRRYMDYHADRFADQSLMAYRNGRLYALLPAHREGDRLLSHGGLTYGGLITDAHTTAADTVVLFQELAELLRADGIRQVYYKVMPWIYHCLPAEEDLYALFRTGHARLVARDIASVIDLSHPLRWERVRRRALARAQQNGITVEQADDFAPFWQILTDNLNHRYGVRPVHTLDEIRLLHARFPDNIVLYNAYHDGKIIAGVVLYLTPQVVHAQYSSSTEEGKKIGAMDALYHTIFNQIDTDRYRFFDFGRSTEHEGSYLNASLIFQKEGLGGRGMCYDAYEWTLYD